jgi:anti-sigma factor RsiW
MTGVPGPVGENDLMAYVDGRLSPERAEAVRGYLEVHPEAEERVSQYAEQREALRAAFSEPVDRPIPARLRVAQLLAERRLRRHWRFAQIAAAICLIVLGSIGGWTARDILPRLASPTSALVARTIMADAIVAHRTFVVEVRHPVEVDADQEAHLVQWLSKRLGRPLVVPDLAATGFRLMGGRLLPAESGPAAQLMYENGSGGRLTVYVRAGVTGEMKLYRDDKGVGAFYWSDEGLGCVIAGEADRGLLRQAAESVYEQTFPDAPRGEFSSEPEKSG